MHTHLLSIFISILTTKYNSMDKDVGNNISHL